MQNSCKFHVGILHKNERQIFCEAMNCKRSLGTVSVWLTVFSIKVDKPSSCTRLQPTDRAEGGRGGKGGRQWGEGMYTQRCLFHMHYRIETTHQDTYIIQHDNLSNDYGKIRYLQLRSKSSHIYPLTNSGIFFVSSNVWQDPKCTHQQLLYGK